MLRAIGSAKLQASLALLCGIVVVNSYYFFFSSDFTGVGNVDPDWQSASGIVERGFITKTYIDEKGVPHRYVVFVPPSMQRQDRLPLILYLNGHGKNGSDGLAPLIDGIAPAIWERTQAFPFVVAWPQCPQGENWENSPRMAEMAVAIMDRTAKEYQTDPDRTYLTGLSSGAMGVWSIAAQYPERFAAIAPISGGTIPNTIQKIISAKLPVWMFSVTQDQGVINKSRENYQQLLEEGLSPRHTEENGEKDGRMDLHDAWSFAFRDSALYRWFLTHNLANNANEQTPYHLINPDRYPASVAATPEPTQGAPQNRVESIAGNASTTCAMSDLSFDEMTELHLEFRPESSAARLAIGFFDQALTPTLHYSTFEVCVSDLSAGGVYSWPAGVCMRSSAPEAEHSLLINRWNDLRLRFISGTISAELNGWPLLNEQRWKAPAAQSKLGFLLTGDEDASIGIRNLRVCRTAHEGLAQKESDAADESLDASHPADSPAEANTFSVSQIATAWRRRDDQFPQVDLQWTNVRSDATQSSTFRSTVASPTSNPDGEQSRLMIDGPRARYSTQWRNWRCDFSTTYGFSGKPAQTDFLAALNSRFTQPPDPDIGRLSLQIGFDETNRIDEVFRTDGSGKAGIICRVPNPWKTRLGELEDLFFRGALLAFRPASSFGAGCDFSRSTVLSKTGWINGSNCLVLEEKIEANTLPLVRRFWVDPRRDFLILRYTTTEGGILREQLDISYQSDATKEWLPVTWTAIAKPLPAKSNSYRYFPDNPELFEVASAKVLNCKREVDSQKLNSREFHAGSNVFDQKQNRWFQQTSADVQRDLNTEEIAALTFGEDQPLSRNVWMDSRLRIALVVVCFGWIVVHRVKRQRSQRRRQTSPP